MLTINGYRLSDLNSGETGKALQGQPDSRLYIVEDTRPSRWLRRWPTLGPKRVLKTIKPDSPNRDLLKKSLEIEIQCLKELNHPGIVRYLDDFALSDIPHLVVEKIPGTTLDQWVDENGIDSEARILDWLTQLADILDHIHSRSILHGDIKPKNIIINQKGELKLIDFGSAQRIDPTYLLRISELNKAPKDLFDEDEDEEEDEDQSIPSSTPGFRASEQKQGKLLPHSDFYMLGTTLEDLLSRSTNKDIPLNPDLRKPLDDMQSELGCIEKRPASAEEVKQALDNIAKQHYRKPRLYGWGEYVKRNLSISLGITSVVIGLRFLGVLQPLELKFFDHTLWMRSTLVNPIPNTILPEHYQPDPNIVIIASKNRSRVDDSYNQTYKEFQEEYHKDKKYSPAAEDRSISNEVLVDIIEKIQNYDLLVIGIDLLNRDISDLENKEIVIGICSLPDPRTKSYLTSPTIGVLPDNIGAINFDKDVSPFEDSNINDRNSVRPVRRHQIIQGDRLECPTNYSLAGQILKRYAEKNQWTIEEPSPDNDYQFIVNGSTYLRLDKSDFFYAKSLYPREQLDTPYETLINYRVTKNMSQNVILIQDLLEANSPSHLSDEDIRSRINGKIVLIGNLEASYGEDFHKTPYGRQAGVIIHAHNVSHLIDVAAGKRRDLQYWSLTESVIWISAWAVSYGLAIFLCRNKKRIIITFFAFNSIFYFTCIVGVFNAWCFPFVPVATIFIGHSVIAIIFSDNSVERWRFKHV